MKYLEDVLIAPVEFLIQILTPFLFTQEQTNHKLKRQLKKCLV